MGINSKLDMLFDVVLFTVLMTAIVVSSGYLLLHEATGKSGHYQRIVTINMAGITNAERSEVAHMHDASDAMLTRYATSPAVHGGEDVKHGSSMVVPRTGKNLLAIIREVAGPGAIVLAKQAIVSGGIPDITAVVLDRLGLPASGSAIRGSSAPTRRNFRRIHIRPVPVHGEVRFPLPSAG